MATKKKAGAKKATVRRPAVKGAGMQTTVTADSVTVTTLRGPIVPARSGPRRG